MLFIVLSITIPFVVTFLLTHSYFLSYYDPSSPLLYTICILGLFISLLYTLPTVKMGKKWVKVFFVFLPFLTVLCLMYNIIATIGVIFVCLIAVLFSPKKTSYKRLLFTNNKELITISYTKKKTPLELYYNFTLITIVPIAVLFACTWLFSTPSRFWQTKAFPVDYSQKEIFSSPASPSGTVSSTIWYDTQSLLVVDLFDINTKNGPVSSPCLTAGIKQGDIITKINGQVAFSSDFITSGGTETVTLDVMRVSGEGKTENLTFEVTPLYDEVEKRHLIGMSFYSSAVVATSVQTVSFVYPETGYCVTTAHDSEDVYPSLDNLQGVLADTRPLGRDDSGLSVAPTIPIGTIALSNNYGAYGVFLKETLPIAAPLPIANKQEVKPGKAVMLSDFEGSGIVSYDIYITGTYRIDNRDVFCFVAEDDRLKAAGGITRGMSGSPILQNGKIVGALSNMDQGGFSAYATYAYDMAHQIYLNQEVLAALAEGGI